MQDPGTGGQGQGQGQGSPPPTWQSAPPPPPPGAGGPQSGGGGNWTANLTSQHPVAGPAGFFYADVPNRAIAYIIDAIIIGIINLIIGAVIGGVLGGVINTDPRSPGFLQFNFTALLVVTLIGLLVSGAYFVYSWTALRGTPGMKVLGMQIGHERDGSTITMNQAVTRWLLLGAPFSVAQLLNPWPGLGLIISLLSLVWLIALLVTTAQSPTKQGLHDKYAHTMVVKAARSVG
jgi:uncharacterized RDD family membrane protein YckC